MNHIRWDVLVPLAFLVIGFVLGTGMVDDALHDTAHSGEALWAMVGSVLGAIVIGVTLWVALDARRTSIAAVDTTKKAEQGYVLPSYVRLSETMKPKEGGGNWMVPCIQHGFMNFGRTPVIIECIQHDTHMLSLDAEVPPPDLEMSKNRGTNHPMTAGESLTTEPRDQNEARLFPCMSDELTRDGIAEVGISTQLVFQGFVIYETMFNERYRRIFTYVRDCVDHDFQPITTRNHYRLDVWRNGAWTPTEVRA